MRALYNYCDSILVELIYGEKNVFRNDKFHFPTTLFVMLFFIYDIIYLQYMMKMMMWMKLIMWMMIMMPYANEED